MTIYINNYKKIKEKEELSSLIQHIEEEKNKLQFLEVTEKLGANDISGFKNKNDSSQLSKSVEQFRTEKRMSNADKSALHSSNLSIQDVFENKTNFINILANKSEKSDKNNEFNMIVEEDSNINTLTYNFQKNYLQMKNEIGANEMQFEENANIQEEIENSKEIKEAIEK